MVMERADVDLGQMIKDKGPLDETLFSRRWAPPYLDKIFRWTLFVHNHAMRCISIGIDETKRKCVNDHPDRQTETISYRLNSDTCSYISQISSVFPLCLL